MQHLTLIRHGYRSDWNLPPTAKMAKNAFYDAQLAPIGVEQAALTAALVVKGSDPVTAIRSSPFRRCLETAAPIATACSVQIVPDWRLGEEITVEHTAVGWNPDNELDPQFQALRAHAIGKPAYPEDDLQIEQRVRALCVELNRTMADGNHVVMVSHEGILKRLTYRLTGGEPYIDWRPCGLTTLIRRNRQQRRWMVSGDLAQVKHLGAAYRDPPTIRSKLEQEAR